MKHDYDWLVVGSGFGGSVSALRLAEKGYRSLCWSAAAAFATRTSPSRTCATRGATSGCRKLGMRGVMRMTFFKDVFIVSGSGVGGGSLGYANTLYRARPAFFKRPPVGRARRLGARAGAALRHGRADARRGRVRGHRPGRQAAAGIRRGDRRRRDLHQHPGRRLLRQARGRGRRPVLRRRGAGPHRLHALRQLHGRLPPRGEEHADEELPLVRREARGQDRARAAGDRDPAARRRRRLRRLRRDQRALRLLAAQAAAHRRPPAAWSSPPAPSAPTTCSPTAATAAPCRRLSDRLGDLVRTNSESIQSVTAPDDERDFSRSVAITSSIYPDPDTHIEVVTYGQGGDAMSGTFTAMTGPGTQSHAADEVAGGDCCATRCARRGC